MNRSLATASRVVSYVDAHFFAQNAEGQRIEGRPCTVIWARGEFVTRSRSARMCSR
jgi:hypothetical protein